MERLYELEVGIENKVVDKVLGTEVSEMIVV